MSRTVPEVMAELLALTSAGKALPNRMPTQWRVNASGAVLPVDGTGWVIWLTPLANEIARWEALAESMMAEVDPATAQYLLTDYERVLGPDPYGRDIGDLTIADRQVLAHNRWVNKFGVRPADFIALAASFGIVITIEEFTDLCTDFYADDECGDHPIEFTWQVNMPAAVMDYIYADQFSADDLVSSFEPSNVQNVIQARNPAEMTLVFNYA
jgi:uncharacterized protein YmfQ (DUF2313 family)